MKFTISLLLVSPLLATATCHSSSCSPPIIKTSSGCLQGFSPRPNVESFIGIPFAQPPIGPLRFLPPVPYRPPKNQKIFDATQPFSSCYQVTYNTMLGDKSYGLRESEDCLFINVWRSSPSSPLHYRGKPAKKLLPVLIWIYGGGFAEGGTQGSDGVRFVEEQKDIIFVDFNYRLNLFGFPNSPELKDKNLGFLDQRLAVEWVRDNIKAFGGDPERMVLMGHSAGSHSVSTWAYAWKDDPIVKGLVTLSGQALAVQLDDGSSWKKVVNATGCLKESGKGEVDCLRKKGARELRRAIGRSRLMEYGELTGGLPVVDNKTVFAPEGYVARGMAGEFAKIPLLASHTLNEGDNVMLWDPQAEIGLNYTESDFITLAAFQCPTSIEAAWRAMHQVPVYRMVYSGNFPQLQPYPWARPFHAADIMLFFGQHLDAAYQEVDGRIEKAAKYLRGAVAAFVRNPEGGLEKFGWPRYNPSAPTIVNLFANNTVNATFIDPQKYDAPCEAIFGPMG